MQNNKNAETHVAPCQRDMTMVINEGEEVVDSKKVFVDWGLTEEVKRKAERLLVIDLDESDLNNYPVFLGAIGRRYCIFPDETFSLNVQAPGRHRLIVIALAAQEERGRFEEYVNNHLCRKISWTYQERIDLKSVFEAINGSRSWDEINPGPLGHITVAAAIVDFNVSEELFPPPSALRRTLGKWYKKWFM